MSSTKRRVRKPCMGFTFIRNVLCRKQVGGNQKSVDPRKLFHFGTISPKRLVNIIILFLAFKLIPAIANTIILPNQKDIGENGDHQSMYLIIIKLHVTISDRLTPSPWYILELKPY